MSVSEGEAGPLGAERSGTKFPRVSVLRSGAANLLRDAYRFVRRGALHALIPASTRPLDVSPGAAIEVVGYPAINAGIAESARLCAADLEKAGFEVRLVDLDRPRRQRPAPAGARIWHLNPPMMPRAVARFGPGRFRAAFNIGYWAWELEELPPEWLKAVRYMNAVFVPSEFIRRTVARHTDKPVICVPHPCRAVEARGDVRASLGLSARTFLAATIFNFSSSYIRKNPAASVRAFRLAFAAGEDAAFIVKTTGASRYPEQLAELERSIGGDRRIRIVDEDWHEEEVTALLKGANAYLSLHRSEGFGLTIAEAIQQGCPTISTAWSGNLDFCRPEWCSLVPYTLIPLNETHPDYAEVQHATWADPDPKIAASQLRWIYEHPEVARERAAAAKVALREYTERNSYGAALRELAGAASAGEQIEAIAREVPGREIRTRKHGEKP